MFFSQTDISLGFSMNLNVYIHSGRIATYNIRVRQTDSISDRTLS